MPDMKNKHNTIRFVDQDVGLLISYDLTKEAVTTRLFRLIKLVTTPLDEIMTLRETVDEDLTTLNRINWLGKLNKRRTSSPTYTFQVEEESPRIFMHLTHGSHMVLKSILDNRPT